jgi:hypothetical protein
VFGFGAATFVAVMKVADLRHRYDFTLFSSGNSVTSSEVHPRHVGHLARDQFILSPSN